MMNEADIKKMITERVRAVLGTTQPRIAATKSAIKAALAEAVVLSPKAFSLKTELLSLVTKENHELLYKGYVDSFNKISAKLDTVLRTDADNPNNSDFRRLKLDEQHNLNGVKLHELYFNNISDLHSEIRLDSLPYIRLSSNWGTFETWQFDFRACGMAATEGWAVLYWEPFKQRYMNTFIEKHTENVPLMGVPVLVVDTWHHAWFRDHPDDKMNYLDGSMQEISWQIVEARMVVAELCNLNQLYMIEPMQAAQTVRMNNTNQPPIGLDQVKSKIPV